MSFENIFPFYPFPCWKITRRGKNLQQRKKLILCTINTPEVTLFSCVYLTVLNIISGVYSFKILFCPTAKMFHSAFWGFYINGLKLNRK